VLLWGAILPPASSDSTRCSPQPSPRGAQRSPTQKSKERHSGEEDAVILPLAARRRYRPGNRKRGQAGLDSWGQPALRGAEASGQDWGVAQDAPAWEHSTSGDGALASIFIGGPKGRAALNLSRCSCDPLVKHALGRDSMWTPGAPPLCPL
jgi:hypothetical protein